MRLFAQRRRSAPVRTAAVALSAIGLAPIALPAAVDASVLPSAQFVPVRFATTGSMTASAWPAQTGTIVYIRANNVWIARADGSGVRQLTRDGTADSPYFSPSEDDAGHVVAARGAKSAARLVRMDQSGHVLQSFAPPVGSLSTEFAQVSPDGKTVAYGALFAETDCSFTPCHTLFTHQLHYTSATSRTAKYGVIDDATHATWMSNSRTLLETSAFTQVDLHDVTSATATTWFTSCSSEQDGCNNTDVDHYTPDESRQGDRYASALEVSPWSGTPTMDLLMEQTSSASTASSPSPPATGCLVQGPDLATPYPSPDQMTVYDPSWSPDGQSVVVAIQSPDTGWGVYRVDVPDLADCSSATVGELIAGASQPFWSRSSLAPIAVTLRYTGLRPAVRGRLAVGQRLHLSRTALQLRNGFTPHATSLAFQWLRDGHPIKAATRAAYYLKRGDRGHRISCRVTGLRSGDHPGQVSTKAVWFA